MTVAEELEQLRLRFENLSGQVPEAHSCGIGLQGWFTAMAGQARLLLIVFNLQAIIEAKTGSNVGQEQDLTLLILEQLREAAVTAEHLLLSDGLIEKTDSLSTPSLRDDVPRGSH